MKTPLVDPETGFTLDIAGMDLPAAELQALRAPLAAAHQEMSKIEAGEIKNPDENRQVTHFTDRIHYCDSEVFRDVQAFAEDIRTGSIMPHGKPVEAVVLNGIGGSALGPQFLQFALNGPYWNELPQRNGWPRIYFLDNTDPAGVNDLQAVLDFERTLVVSVSKSGGTQETRNNMLALQAEFEGRGLHFPNHAVAVTMTGSKLDRLARETGWLRVFPMAESIGGRTSETNVVGHVPAALAGIDFQQFVGGATHMDQLTRTPELEANPAYQLAAVWYVAGNGRGDRNMVVVPYSDRLVLLAKYLQQLVMESLGKELDLDGNVVHQGLTVYGNKGGTDAHAYIQQLNDGRDDFFALFVEPLRDAECLPTEDGLTMGDYLHAFKTGLIKALRGKSRKVIDILIDQVDAFNLGMIVALFERAVAVYAELIHINAFHQPGVQAYKLASQDVNAVSKALRTWMAGNRGWTGTAAQAAEAAGTSEVDVVNGLLLRAAANGAGAIRAWNGKTWQFTLD